MNGSTGRQHDPRRLSKSKPGRSEIQDDPPSLPPASPTNDNRETVGDYRRNQGVKEPDPSTKIVKRRALRRRGAMKPGTDPGVDRR